MLTAPARSAEFNVTRLAPTCRSARVTRLLRDRRGLTTLEFGLLFVLIVIGAIALWNKLGDSTGTQVAGGTATFSRVLQSARERTAEPGVSVNSVAPPPADAASPAAASSHGFGNAGAAPAAAAVNSGAIREPSTATPRESGGRDDAASVASARGGGAQPKAATTHAGVPADHGDWRSRSVGTGGKVAAVAAGAVAGAALAAGTSIATAYAASLACGPGAAVCAGAVTAAIAVGMAAYGVNELRNGGWAALKGSLSRVFSSEDATVGDALSVGTTLGAAAYGIGTTGLSGAAGVARGEAIAGIGARAGVATRAEIANLLPFASPELAMAGVPNAVSNPLPAIVRMPLVAEAGSSEAAATSGSATNAGLKSRPAQAASEATQAGDSAAGKLPRFQGPKPEYSVNPAHVPGRGLRPGKTPLPNDAEQVFGNAVPNDPKSPTAWFGRNSEGQIYRYSLGGDGTAHFSGIHRVGDGTRNITRYALDRLDGR